MIAFLICDAQGANEATNIVDARWMSAEWTDSAPWRRMRIEVERDLDLRRDPVAWLTRRKSTLFRQGEREQKFRWIAAWLLHQKNPAVVKAFERSFPWSALPLGGFATDLSAENARQWALFQGPYTGNTSPESAYLWKGIARVSRAFPQDAELAYLSVKTIPTTRDTKNHPAAYKALRRFALISPGDWRVPALEAQVHMNAAMRHEYDPPKAGRRGDPVPEWRLAVLCFDRAIALNPPREEKATLMKRSTNMKRYLSQRK